jgi:hypothetical protein
MFKRALSKRFSKKRSNNKREDQPEVPVNKKESEKE